MRSLHGHGRWSRGRVVCPTRGTFRRPLDPDRFSIDDRPGFLLTSGGGSVSVTPSPGLEVDADQFAGLLNAPKGLPLDPIDLVTADA